VEKPDPAPHPSSGELHPSKRVDRGDVRIEDPSNVAHHELLAAALEHVTNALAQPRDARASDPPLDDENDRAPLGMRPPGMHHQ